MSSLGCGVHACHRVEQLALIALLPTTLAAQAPSDLARERAEFATWLTTAPNSPYAAVALAPLSRELVLGPDDADVPLRGMARLTLVEERGVIRIRGVTPPAPLPRNRPIVIAPYRLYLSGEPGRSTVTVFGRLRDARAPSWYPYDSTAIVTGGLAGRDAPRTQRMLALDGVEVEATDAGTFGARLGGRITSLRVYRIPESGTEESELMIYFRDSTSAHGTYPAGRFVALVPLPDGRYRADFNRARNPFCAYSTVYPCPVPWPGNTIPARVEAGERYSAHDDRAATRP